jgi:hypothetical protein
MTNENNGASRAVEETPAPTPTEQASFPTQLSREDLLYLENLSLKTQNMALQEQRLQQDLIKSNEMRRTLQADLEKAHKEMSAKYGVDLMAQTTRILPDGKIINLARQGDTVVGHGAVPSGVIHGGERVKA